MVSLFITVGVLVIKIYFNCHCTPSRAVGEFAFIIAVEVAASVGIVALARVDTMVFLGIATCADTNHTNFMLFVDTGCSPLPCIAVCVGTAAH